MRCEDLAHGERGGGRGVDDANVAAGDLLDGGAQERVVRASEEECVDDWPDDPAFRQQWLDVLAYRVERRGAIRLPILDQRHELRAGLLRHVDERVEIA